VSGICWFLAGPLIISSQFPVDEVTDFQEQLMKIEEELGEAPPKDAQPDDPIEKRYIERLKVIQYGEDAVHTGKEVVLDLLGRCQLWSQIVLSRFVRAN